MVWCFEVTYYICSFRLPSSTVEQVTNVVLYSNDKYVRAVALEETS